MTGHRYRPSIRGFRTWRRISVHFGEITTADRGDDHAISSSGRRRPFPKRDGALPPNDVEIVVGMHEDGVVSTRQGRAASISASATVSPDNDMGARSHAILGEITSCNVVTSMTMVEGCA